MFARLAIDADVEAFVELARAGHEESLGYLPFSADEVRATFRAYLETANPTIWVVDQRREVVGFLLATLSKYRSATGFYATQEVLFVRPDKRGTRAAVLLLGQLVAWADRLGAREITGGNDNSLRSEQTARLLAAFGFEEVGRFMRRHHGEKGRRSERR